MRELNYSLQPGQAIQVPGRVSKIIIREAWGPVRIRTGSEDIPGRLSEVIVLEVEAVSFLLTNDYDGPNQVQLIIVESSGGDIRQPSSSVDVNSLPPVQLRADSAANGLAQLVAAEGANVLPGNANRRAILLHAGGANAGQLWIGGGAVGEGIPLDADDTVELRVSGAIPVYATVAGDTLNGLETV